jgi:hypothetical protein
MSSRDVLPGQQDTTELAANEVQFALVISRMLETVKDDPEFLRQIVYDLARYKLQEQFTYADAKHIDRMKRALEVAIQEVEQFSREQAPLERLPPQHLTPVRAIDVDRPRPAPGIPQSDIETSRSEAKAAAHPLWPVLRRTAVLLLAAGIPVLVVTQRDHIAALRRWVTIPRQEAVAATARPAPAATKPARVLPSDYGIYALVDDRSLAELSSVVVDPPDIRIAISAAFKKPDRPQLANGRVKFIVFRREAVNAIPERAEIRVMAKIAREFSSDAAGRKLSDSDDAWVIRNFSYPLRAAPVQGAPDMYELHSEEPALELPPGNYVLNLKSQAYYFQVAGNITDPRQCLEQILAASGTYYSACTK